ncbi:protein cmss1-like [Nannochloropsis oceanica]
MGDTLDDGFEAYDLEADAEEFADDDEPLIEAGLSKRKAEDWEEGKDKKSKQQSKKQKQKVQATGGEEEEEGGEVEEEEEEEEEEGDIQDEDNKGTTATDGERVEKKKKKRKRKSKIPKPTAALTTAEAQSTYLWERYVNLLNVSPLDADVNRFPPTCFTLPSSSSSSGFTALKRVKGKQPAKPTGHAQTSDSHPGKGDANVTDFLQQAFPQLQKIASDKSQREMAHPFVVLLSSSAVRANELAKDLRMKLRNLKTAKLFAKHLKVDAQVEVLQSEFNALAVGTPNRLIKLLEMNAMSLARCRLVVLDSSFKDSKSFDLLTLPGVAKDTALLLRDHVLPAMTARKERKDVNEQLRLALF